MRNFAPLHTIQNSLLAALPEEFYQRLSPHLEPIALENATVLYEMEAPIDYFYFPFNAVISLVTQMKDGRIVEVGLVGNEGMTGLAALFGQKVSAERAIVQISNGGTRTTSLFSKIFKRSAGTGAFRPQSRSMSPPKMRVADSTSFVGSIRWGAPRGCT